MKRNLGLFLIGVLGIHHAIAQYATSRVMLQESNNNLLYPRMVMGKDGLYLAGIRNITSGVCFIAKTDFNNSFLWINKVTGTYGIRNIELAATSDSGFVLAIGDLDASRNRIQITKHDANGVPSWKTRITLGSVYPYNLTLSKIIQTKDGGYAVTGSYQSGKECFFVSRLDAQGSLSWTSLFPQSTYNMGGTDLIETSDGGFLAAGGNYQSGTPDKCALLKTDSLGNGEWFSWYDFGITAIPGNASCAYSIREKKPGSFLLGFGHAGNPSNGSFHGGLFEIDSAGNVSGDASIVWGVAGKAFTETPDHGTIMIGMLDTIPLETVVVKFDSLNQVEWTRRIDRLPLYYGIIQEYFGYDIEADISGIYVVANQSKNKQVIMDVKFDPNGYSCSDSVSIPYSDSLHAGQKVSSSASQTFVTMTVSPNAYTYVPWNIDSSLCQVVGTQEAQFDHPQIQIYPNPSREQVNLAFRLAEAGHVQYSVTDTYGRIVQTAVKHNLSPGLHNLVINTAFFSDGTYLLRVTTGSGHFMKKMVLLNK